MNISALLRSGRYNRAYLLLLLVFFTAYAFTDVAHRKIVLGMVRQPAFTTIVQPNGLGSTKALTGLRRARYVASLPAIFQPTPGAGVPGVDPAGAAPVALASASAPTLPGSAPSAPGDPAPPVPSNYDPGFNQGALPGAGGGVITQAATTPAVPEPPAAMLAAFGLLVCGGAAAWRRSRALAGGFPAVSA